MMGAVGEMGRVGGLRAVGGQGAMADRECWAGLKQKKGRTELVASRSLFLEVVLILSNMSFYPCRLECILVIFACLLRHIARYAPQQTDKYASKIQPNPAVDKIKTASYFLAILPFMNIRTWPILANMQLKNGLCRLDFPYVPFRIPKRPVSHCDMACFGLQNGTFRKAKRPVLQLVEYQTFGQGDPRRRL